ncbi:MAG: hypothetical protein QOE59_878 [Actinomycetota bacterium]|nr:hypothetical protein [Actinomycetota bacterium]
MRSVLMIFAGRAGPGRAGPGGPGRGGAGGGAEVSVYRSVRSLG